MSKVPVPTTPQVVLGDITKRVQALEATFPPSAVFNPNTDYAIYNPVTGALLTVGSGSGAQTAWSPDFGNPTLLDLTNPTAPVVTVRGVYTFDVTFSSTDSDSGSNWTEGATMSCVVTANAASLFTQINTVPSNAYDCPTGGDRTIYPGHVSLTAPMDVGASITVQMNNNDTLTHHFLVDVTAVRVFGY